MLGEDDKYQIYNTAADSSALGIIGYAITQKTFVEDTNIFVKNSPQNFAQGFLKGIGSVKNISSITAGIGAALIYQRLKPSNNVSQCSDIREAIQSSHSKER